MRSNRSGELGREKTSTQKADKLGCFDDFWTLIQMVSLDPLQPATDRTLPGKMSSQKKQNPDPTPVAREWKLEMMDTRQPLSIPRKRQNTDEREVIAKGRKYAVTAVVSKGEGEVRVVNGNADGVAFRVVNCSRQNWGKLNRKLTLNSAFSLQLTAATVSHAPR